MKSIPSNESVASRAFLYHAMAIAGAAAIVAAVYLDVLDAPFLWDDYPLLQQNCVRSLCKVQEYLKLPFWDLSLRTPGTGLLYRPLTTFSLAIDHALYGLNATGFHATNLFFHMLNFVLVAVLAVRLGASRVNSVVYSLLWALLPRLAESVAWISGRTDILCTSAALSCLLVWKSNSSRRRFIAVGLGVLSALAKEAGLAALVGLIAAEYLTLPKLHRWRRLALPAVAAGAYLYLRHRVLGSSGVITSVPLTIAQRVITVFEAIGRYVWMSVDMWHPSSQMGVVSEPRFGFVALGVIMIVGLAVGTYRLRPKYGPFAVAVLVTGVLPIVFVIHLIKMPWIAVVGDRLAYLPWTIACCGLAIAATRVQTRGGRWQFWPSVLTGVVIVTLIPRTRSRERLFADEIDFWIDAVATTAPSNWGPSISLSGLYLRAGWPERSLAILESLDQRCPPPLQMQVRSAKAKSLWRMGQYRRALDLIQRPGEPGSPETLLMSSRLRMSLFDVEGADSDCSSALQASDGSADAVQVRSTLERAKRVALEMAGSNDGKPKDWLRAQYDMLSGRLVESEQEWLRLLPRQDVPTPAAEEGLALICELGSAARVREALATYRQRSDFKTALAWGCEDRLRFAERLDSQWAHVTRIFSGKELYFRSLPRLRAIFRIRQFRTVVRKMGARAIASCEVGSTLC